jgi:hypothetical protein
MSIADRIEDAHLLWRSGRKEGAFLCVLIAVAAAARSRFPGENDRNSFERFIHEATPVKMGVEYRGQLHRIKTILYKFLRCELVHEGGIPQDIRFIDDELAGAMTIRAGGHPEFVLLLGTGWFFHLVRSVS